MPNDRFHEQLYRKFVRFFDEAEEKRRSKDSAVSAGRRTED